MTCPRYQHSFLHAQNGLFLYDLHANEHYCTKGKWPIFEDIIEDIWDKKHNELCKKLTLPVSETEHLLQLLWRERISQAHLMPTHDNITEALKFKWTWPRREF